MPSVEHKFSYNTKIENNANDGRNICIYTQALGVMALQYIVLYARWVFLSEQKFDIKIIYVKVSFRALAGVPPSNRNV